MGNRKTIPFDSRENGRGVCLACKRIIDHRGGFACKQCRKSPFCVSHLDGEFKVCPGCAAENRIKSYNNLLRQEKSLRGSLKLSEFIFIVVAILFASERLFPDFIPDFMRENIFFQYIFVWGALAVLGILICSLFLPAQRRKLQELDSSIREQRAYRKYSVF